MYDNCWEIENFSTCEEISVQLMGSQCNLCRFVAKSVIQAVLLRNFGHNYALSCGEQMSPKVHLWRKMTNMRSDFVMVILRMLCSFKVEIAIYLCTILLF